MAVFKGNKNAVKLLLDAGADPNKTDREGKTSLFWAAGKGLTDIVTLLLMAGAHPNQANNHLQQRRKAKKM